MVSRLVANPRTGTLQALGGERLTFWVSNAPDTGDEYGALKKVLAGYC